MASMKEMYLENEGQIIQLDPAQAGFLRRQIYRKKSGMIIKEVEDFLIEVLGEDWYTYYDEDKKQAREQAKQARDQAEQAKKEKTK